MERRGNTTLYQWGRKDPFPSTNPAVGTLFKQNAGNHIYMQAIIQNPGYFYVTEGGGTIPGSSYLTQYYYFYNLWSVNNTSTDGNDNVVVKTIYDPSPVGFQVPASNAFTGFTSNGVNKGPKMVDGTEVPATYNSQTGHIFWTNSEKKATIYFPATGFRENGNGNMVSLNVSANYWTAIPQDLNNGRCFAFSQADVYPLYSSARTYGLGVRPVAE